MDTRCSGCDQLIRLWDALWEHVPFNAGGRVSQQELKEVKIRAAGWIRVLPISMRTRLETRSLPGNKVNWQLPLSRASFGVSEAGQDLSV